MQVTIHIGMPKCASSTIQAHYADNDAFYWSQGLLYPKSYRLAKGYRHHGRLFNAEVRAATAVSDILAEARAKSCDKIILSTEQFSTDRSGRLADIARAFEAELGAQALSILFLIREPIGLLRSSYAQFVKAGLWGIHRTNFYNDTDASIDAYIDAFKDRWGFDWYEVDRILDHAVRDVPHGQKLIWDLSQDRNVTERLAKHFGVRHGAKSGAKNERLSPTKIRFLRDFQKTFGQKAYDDNKRRLVNAVDLSQAVTTQSDFMAAGLDFEDTTLQSRFPNMDEPRQRLLSLK